MDIQRLTAVFKWCVIINVVLFVLSATMIMAAPDFVYRMQSNLIPIPRETFDAIVYGLLGFYKVVLVVFVVVPYVALLIVGKKDRSGGLSA